MLLEFKASDVPQVHFVGSINDAQGAGEGVHLGKGHVITNTGTAEYLDGSIDDIEGHSRNSDFDSGNFGAGLLRTDLVDHPGGLECEKTGLFDCDS
jgi:hypothetical protein